MSAETKSPYAYSGNKYADNLHFMDNTLNRFSARFRLRYILLLIVFLSMSSIIISIHYTLIVNHISIIRPRIIDLHRLTLSKFSHKPVQSDECKTIIHKGETEKSNQSLKYHFTTIAGVNNSVSRHIKTQYPVTLDAPYLLSNPNLCKSEANLSALVIVHTAPKNFERRDVMRKTWTNNSYFHHLGYIRILFLLGTVLDNATQRKIEDEFEKYEDLVQGNFIDAYKNLTHKGVMGYKWISENCMNAQLIVKVDDDVLVDTYKLLTEYIPKLSGRKRYILCNHIIFGTMPILRARTNKWYIDSDFFRGYDFYPQYCSGFSVIISVDIIPFLYRAAYITPFFWVDDVYLYGMLPSHAKNITYISFSETFPLNFTIGLECIESRTKACPCLIYDGHKSENVLQLWDAMKRAHERTFRINLKSSNTSTKIGDENKES